jgi:hypothetical protein
MFASSGVKNAENAETSTPVLTAGRRRGVFSLILAVRLIFVGVSFTIKARAL